MQEERIEEHGFIASTIFKSKVLGLTLRQFGKNLISPNKRFNARNELKEMPVVSFSESDLWNTHDTNSNWILTAGKIENLRIAALHLNDIEVGANETFSFWKHIGNPNFGKGYVVGREIREGCIVPTIAGGLCQISNALYDAALKANFEIVERHKHTKVIKGSLAEKDRDATVKWNYLDLKFKSNNAFRIEVELSSDQLLVSFKSANKNTKTITETNTKQASSELNDCYSCGNTACFKHPNKVSEKQKSSITTYLLDEKWPEYDDYIKSITEPSDFFITSLKKNTFIKSDRYSWTTKNNSHQTTLLPGLKRAHKLRRLRGNNVFAEQLKLDATIAHAMAKKIPVNSSHLVISQNLLPALMESGALGGRTFDVLMTRLPIEMLQEKLNKAAQKHPDSPTLNDFRASKEVIVLENKALTKARNIITPHKIIADVFKHKSIHLKWQLPETKKVHLGAKLLFPSSTVGRKGCYELRELVKKINYPISISGRNLENSSFWDGIEVEKFSGNLNDIGLVVYPAHIENQPRQLLRAISKDIPVVISSECGIEPTESIVVIDVNNTQEFIERVKQLLPSIQDKN